MALLPPHWLDCVVALGERGRKRGDDTHWMATGFFYVHVTSRDDERVSGKAFLVTARHVVEGRDNLLLRVNPSTAEPARQFQVDLRNRDGEPPCCLLPDDEAVDLTLVPVDLGLLRSQGMRMATFLSDRDVVDRDQLGAEGVSEGDGVFILGFPMGDVGGERSHVIVRGGTIARIRDALAGHSDTMLLDCFVYPGNSGGPVVLRPQASAIAGTTSPSRALLLGLVKSYEPYQDVAISRQTGRPRVLFEENTGLASAHPIDLVADLARRHAQSGGGATSHVND
jgi:S1-C subfamily serine protease